MLLSEAQVADLTGSLRRGSFSEKLYDQQPVCNLHDAELINCHFINNKNTVGSIWKQNSSLDSFTLLSDPTAGFNDRRQRDHNSSAPWLFYEAQQRRGRSFQNPPSNGTEFKKKTSIRAGMVSQRHCIVKSNLFFWQRADYNHLVAALKGDSLCRLYFFCKNPLGLWRHSKSHGARWEDATAFFYSTRVRKLAVNIQHTLRSWKGHRESDCWLTCCVTVCRSVWCPEMEQLRQVCCDRYTLTRLNGEH